MFICITNGKNKDSEMYDGFYELNNIEGIIVLSLENYVISQKGVCLSSREAISKVDLQKNYQRGINQIVMNDRDTNYTYETPTGEVIEFVGKKNHLEKQIGKEETTKEEKQIKF